MRIMGLDVGDRRIGVALSDEQGTLAGSPTVLDRLGDESDFKTIAELVSQHSVQRIVVGLPLSMDGSLGHQAKKVQSFCQKLAYTVDIPVVTWDERLSTVEAERILRESNVRRNKRKKRRDAVAAALILQTYLDFQRNR